tara:strand:- start:147 stop:566 length:420 start_codon:yes stop_codon:yes gene_type:complete
MKLAARLAASKLASIDDRIMPLINMVFLLLIFFLVAGAIREVEPVEVDPPRSLVEAESMADALTIYVASDGRIALGETLLERDAFDLAIAAALASDPDQPIRIVADRDIEAVNVISILETLRASGSSRVKLVTQMQAAP